MARLMSSLRFTLASHSNKFSQLAISAWIVAGLLISSAPLVAQPPLMPCEIEKLTASDAGEGHNFGISVAQDGEVILVGSWLNGPGAAYIFRGDDAAVEEAQLLPLVGEPGDGFGVSVDVAGDVAVVGAYLDDEGFDDAGSVAIHRFDGLDDWPFETQLFSPTPGEDDQFGISVAIDADTVVVGSWQSDTGGEDRGEAFVFRFDGLDWLLEDTLSPPDGMPGDLFGVAVAIDDDRIVVGARGHDAQGPDAGAAYVFRRQGAAWVFEMKLVAEERADLGFFGVSVDLEGERAIVGSTFAPGAVPASGTAYVFRRDGQDWSQESVLFPPDGEMNDQFGTSVALSPDGSTAWVGAILDDDLGSASGSVSSFGRTGQRWSFEEKIVASDGATSDRFGVSVALGSQRGVIGSRRHNSAAEDAGAAYRIAAGGLDCNGNGTPDICDLVSGRSPDTNGNGIPDECDPRLRRGDVDHDGIINALADAVFLLNFQFLPGSPVPPCLAEGDANDDGAVEGIEDALYILNFGFLGGPVPPPPFPECGVDPSIDVPCEESCR